MFHWILLMEHTNYVIPFCISQFYHQGGKWQQEKNLVHLVNQIKFLGPKSVHRYKDYYISLTSFWIKCNIFQFVQFMNAALLCYKTREGILVISGSFIFLLWWFFWRKDYSKPVKTNLHCFQVSFMVKTV